jgi:hypothetical protein
MERVERGRGGCELKEEKAGCMCICMCSFVFASVAGVCAATDTTQGGRRGAGKENTPEGGVYFVLYVFVLYFVLYSYFWAPATRDRCGGRKRDGASCLGCTLGTWLCSMCNSISYHVSCYRFVSQHTYIYHICPHAHVDTDKKKILGY